MVQTFAVFVDNPTTAKIKNVISFNSPSWYRTMQGFVAKIRTAKISSGAYGGIFAKVCTRRNFLLYIIKYLLPLKGVSN